MKSKQAFTLIEILVIIVIIGILSTLATISLKVVVGKARDSRRMSDVASIRKALEIYKLNNEVYPPENQFIVGAALKNGEDLVLGKIPTNPKAVDGPCAINEYLYRQDNNGLSYHLNWCLGTQVQDAGPGPCIATPNHYCAPCTNGTCVNKCGGDNGCGQPCPATACNNVNNSFCNPAANYSCTCLPHAVAPTGSGQPGACPHGKYCSANGTCINNNVCGNDYDCAGLCKRCVNVNGTNTCINQNTGQDIKNECGTNNCFTGDCFAPNNGSAAYCGVYDSGTRNCDTSGGKTNNACIGNLDGSCSCTPSQCGGATGRCPGASNGCGTSCDENIPCSASSCCNNSTGNCMADKTTLQFCQTYNGLNLLTCGNTTGVDNCGNTKTVNCTMCKTYPWAPYSCGACQANKCGSGTMSELPYPFGLPPQNSTVPSTWFCGTGPLGPPGAAALSTCDSECKAAGYSGGTNKTIGINLCGNFGVKLPCCGNNSCIPGLCSCNYICDTSRCICNPPTCFNQT